MRPIDHFLSQADRLALSLKPGEVPGEESKSRLLFEFSSLVSPVTGREAAEDLFCRSLERHGPGALQKLGAMAAFLLGEYDDSMDLEKEDWEDLRETLEEVSEEIDLNTLTSLMGDLLSRGKLN
jgi:hypothetical protein